VIKVLASGPFLHVEVAKLVYLTYWCRAWLVHLYPLPDHATMYCLIFIPIGC
jgi:hypothetical protein